MKDISSYLTIGRGYAIGRTLIAASTALTLILTPTYALFPTGLSPDLLMGVDFAAKANLFALVPGLSLARWIAVAALLLVASGWRPRITGVLHCWVTMSFHVSGALVDGGDQLCSNLALLMLPATLLDGRRSHWDAVQFGGLSRSIIARTSVLAVQGQMCIVYLHASLGKMSKPVWADGTAMFYWSRDSHFPASSLLEPIIHGFFATALGTHLVTWSVLALELLLGVYALLDRRLRRPLLVTAVIFHLGIIFQHGITSFAIAMIGGVFVLGHKEWEGILVTLKPGATRLWAHLRHRGDDKPAPTTQAAPARQAA